MSAPRVRIEVKDAVGSVILDRERKRNAIDWTMLQELKTALETVRADPAVRVVVVRGAGKVFSSGIDLTSLVNLANDGGRPPGVALREKIAWIQHVFGRLGEMEKPVIAVLHGMCVGLALELALAADFRVAASETILGLPEIVLGIIPDCGGCTRLSRLVGATHAKKLILTGESITAEAALAIGLVDEVVGPEALEAHWTSLAADLANRSPLAVGLAKRVIDACHSTTPERQLDMEAFAQSMVLAAPDFSKYLAAGVQELMGRRKAIPK